MGEPEPLAEALNVLLRDPDRAEAMGQAGRKRAVSEFGWPAIAAQTADLYAELAHSGLKTPFSARICLTGRKSPSFLPSR